MSGEQVAILELLIGSLRSSPANGEARVGSTFDAGAEIETATDGVATLRLVGGPSVRLDSDTTLRFESATRFSLDRGAVYLDTGQESGQAVEVSTRFGVARDVGTRFAVRILDDGMQVRVRDGEVEVARDEVSHTVSAGSSAIFRDGAMTRGTVLAHGPEWDWMLRTVPPFELKGRTLAEALDWVARETGWQPRFLDPDLEPQVIDSIIRGSIPDLQPGQAPAVVLPIFGLRHRLADGILWIEREDAAAAE